MKMKGNIKRLRSVVCAAVVSASLFSQGVVPVYAATVGQVQANAQNEGSEYLSVQAVEADQIQPESTFENAEPASVQESTQISERISAETSVQTPANSTPSESFPPSQAPSSFSSVGGWLEDMEKTRQGPYTPSSFLSVGGWLESIYAEIDGITASEVTGVSYTGAMEGYLSETDLRYLVRDKGEGTVRIDVPGLKAGTYDLTVSVGETTLKETGITVKAYDRSGYAHFKYDEGVGAYNDDGTLKSNAIVLYVTDGTKNEVTLNYGGKTVTGIGNILNSAGQSPGGGKANTNQGIIKILADNNVPLLVRFIGTVSDSGLYKRATKEEPFDQSQPSLISGLTAYNSRDYGGGQNDNGHMAYMKSGKNITLEGIGSDAVIDGWGFGFSVGKGFEVRNLTFINTPEDAVGMDGNQSGGDGATASLTSPVERCWIHNNEFYCPRLMYSADPEGDKYEGDGSMDFKRGRYLTCSYNYFEGCHKTNLIGGDDNNLQYNLTFHHNHWLWCQSRGPLSRRANIHMYNNFFEMQTSYCENVRANGFIFSEYNLFYTSQNPHSAESGGVIKSYNDNLSSCKQTRSTEEVYYVSSRYENVPNQCAYGYGNIDYSAFETDPALSYIPEGNYEIQEDFIELRKVLAAFGGTMDAGPFMPSEAPEKKWSRIYRTVGNDVRKISDIPFGDVPGNLDGSVYAFEVDRPVNVEVAYGEEKGALVNAAGATLLDGDGFCIELPAGKYMLQPLRYTSAEYKDGENQGVFPWYKINVSSLKITGNENNRSISFDHNYEGSPEPIVSKFIDGYEVDSLEAFIPGSLARVGYDLTGLFKDRNLESKISFPYTVERNETLYAGWKKQCYLIFETGGGSPVGRVRLPVEGIYEITQGSARDGYVFAGWFDSPDGGHPVKSVDAKDVDSDVTVYARWIPDTAVINSLDCPQLEQGDITENKTVDGFTIHATSGSIDSTKLYMTAKENMLYTNGVLLTDTSIPGNEDGLLKAIEITVEKAGTLSVTFSLSGNPELGKSYSLVLSKKDGTGMTDVEVYVIDQGKTMVTKDFAVGSAGTYYLFARGDKGVRYSGIVFRKIAYPVLIDGGAGTLPEGLSDRMAEEGERIELPPCEPPSGYDFTGWTVDGTTTLDGAYLVKTSDMVDGLITIRALYEEIPDDPFLPDLPDKKDLEVTMIPGEVRRLSISRTGQFFYGVRWSVTYPEAASKNCVSVKNGVVTAKNLKKNVAKGKANVTAEYGAFSCTFNVTVDGTSHNNEAVIDGGKKYNLTAPKTLNLSVNDARKKTVTLKVPKALQEDVISIELLTPGVCELKKTSPASEKAKLVYEVDPLDAGATWIQWTADHNGKAAKAYTKVIVKKPISEITPSVNAITLNAGQGMRLIVTGTMGNTETKDITFSVKMTSGKGIKVSKSGFVSADSPDSTGVITVKAGSLKKIVNVKVPGFPGSNGPLTMSSPSVNAKIPKTGTKSLALKIGKPKKDKPPVTWGISEEVHTGITIEPGTGKLNIASKAIPGCYTVIATPTGADAANYNSACCEIVVK